MKMRLERLENGNVRVGIPVPFPMKYVYCYLMKNDSGYTMVDTGFHYSKATQAWEEIFNKLRLAPGDIHTIVLTHFHPDHSGLAGWMQAKTGANVWMSEVDLKMMQLAFGERSEEHTSELQSRFDLVCRLLLEKKKQRSSHKQK